MVKQNIIAGLDLGSSKVAISVGQIQEGIINVIGIGKAPNSGMRKGAVIDIEETVSAISAATEEAERMAGVSVSNVFIGINGPQIASSISKGIIAVSRADGEITENDANRVIEAARAIALPHNQEIIHIIPRNFSVDGQNNIKDPVGMTGIRLEVNSLVVGMETTAIKNLSKCVYQAGLEIEDIIYSPLAAAKAFLSKKQKDVGVMLVDFGASTCALAVFEEGEVISCQVIPVGSMHITNDIAIGLRISIEIAEKIKLKYANANPDDIKEKQMIDLSVFDPQEKQRVEAKYIAEIVEARLGEIFILIRDYLRKIGKDGMLPGGIVFTGGGSQLQGLVEFSKETLRLPTQLAYPVAEVSGLIDKLDDPVYANSVGLMLWGAEEGKDRTTKLNLNAHQVGKIMEKARGFIKQFLP